MNNVNFDDNVQDGIVRRGQYSAKSVYELRFLGSTSTSMHKTVCKALTSPTWRIFFCFVANQNRIWMADWLVKRGWPNCDLCPLCKQYVEYVDHIFVHCHFTIGLWRLTREWIGIPQINTNQWAGFDTLEWCKMMSEGPTPNRKAMASLTLLMAWEVLNERNDRSRTSMHLRI
jgi:hypothetical protein